MTKKECVEKIKTTMNEMKIEKKSCYPINELEKISKAVGCDMIYVMKYLRYGRI